MKLPYLVVLSILALAAPTVHAKKHAPAHAAAPAQNAPAAQSAPAQDTAPAAPPPAQTAAQPASNLPTPQAVPKPAAAPVPGNGPTPPPPAIDAKSWVLMDYASGQILAGSNEDLRVAPASITKVMTSYAVSAELAHGKIHMNDEVFISERAWRSGGAGTDGSTSFLQLNSKVALKDLLYGMIIQSGNDAAIALAEGIAGTEPTFAGMMNQLGKEIGLTNSNFVNATGLPDPDQYSSAHDLATIGRFIIAQFPEYYPIFSEKEFTWNKIRQMNRNSLLEVGIGVDGLKTGHTEA
jgi:D-alanyl-D-alanine carboxypeptidase (penicillin-binding protein 5/6)